MKLAPALLAIFGGLRLAAGGAETIAPGDDELTFWSVPGLSEGRVKHEKEDTFFTAHGFFGEEVPFADLHGQSIRDYLLHDQARKEVLAVMPVATPAKADRYYGWTFDQVKAKWGIPIQTYTEGTVISTPRKQPPGPKPWCRLCSPVWKPVYDTSIRTAFRVEAYEIHDEKKFTAFFFYDDRKTVGGGFFKGMPILSPKLRQQVTDGTMPSADSPASAKVHREWSRLKTMKETEDRDWTLLKETPYWPTKEPAEAMTD